MATEVEELKLRITVDDQASAQLGRVHQQLSQIGSGPTNQSLHQLTAKTTEAEKAFGRLSREALGVGSKTMDFAKILGPLPVTLGVLAFEFVRQLGAMKEWAAQAVQINNAARMAGVNIGSFRGIQEALKGSGIDAQQSAQMMQNLTRTLSEASRPGSAVREGLLRMAGPQFAGAMMNSLETLSRMRDATDRINYIRHQGLNVYANEFARTHDEMRARYSQLLYLQQFGAEQLINQREDIHKLDKVTLDNMAAEATKQDQLNAALVEEESARNRILEIIKSSFLAQETGAAKATAAVEKYIVKVLEADEKAHRSSVENNDWKYFFSAPWMTPQNFSNPTTKGSPPHPSTGPSVPGPGRGVHHFQEGGIATGPTLGLMGEAGPEAVIPLTGMGEGSRQQVRHTETLDANTKQLAALNQKLEGILNPSIGAYGQGMGCAGSGGAGGGGFGGGGGGGGGYGTPGTPGGPGGTDGTDGTTGGTIPAPPPPMGSSGAPLGGVMGNMPFGINVSPEKFSQITGLPPSFMNVSPADRARARGISTGMTGVGLGGQFIGGTPALPWPVTAGGGGGGGTVGKSLLGHFSAEEQAHIQKIADQYGISPEAIAGVAGIESNWGTDMGEHKQYKGLFAMNKEEGYPGPDRPQQIDAYGRMIAAKSYMAKFKDAGIDITKLSPAEQAGILQGFQFAPNAKGWLRDPNKITATGQSAQISKYGTSRAGMTKVFEEMMGGTQAGAPVTAQGPITVSPITGLPVAAGAAGTASVGGGSGAISGSALAEATALAAEAARTGNHSKIQKWLGDKGIHMDDLDCGEFVAGIMAHSGVTPPKGYSFGSTFAAVGTGVSGGLANAQAGDILGSTLGTYGGGFGRPIPPGAKGGHAAIIGPRGRDPLTGKVEIVQDDPPMDKMIGPGDKQWDFYNRFFAVRRLQTAPTQSPVAGAGTRAAPQAGVYPGAPTAPGSMQAATGAPSAFIVHHTGPGISTVEQLQSTLQGRRVDGETGGLGVEYTQLPSGEIVQVGQPGAKNIRPEDMINPKTGKTYGTELGASLKLRNENIVGIEVMAANDAAVKAENAKMLAAWIQQHYPQTPVYGHGEIQRDKEPDEGRKVTMMARQLRANAVNPAAAQTAGAAAPDAITPSAQETASAGAKPQWDWPTDSGDRSAMDKMMGNEISHNVDTSGTITIKHDRRPNRFQARAKPPPFRDVPTNRQGSMQPAESGRKAPQAPDAAETVSV